MPVVIATSVFFNRFLVPRFLLTGRKVKFALYFFYMLIISIYLELLVMVLAFVILADYQIQNLGKIAGDIYLLTIILYLVVLIEGLILSIQKLRENSDRIKEIESQLESASQTEISVRVNRKNMLISLSDIMFIESLGDYVQIITREEKYTTKEKISSLNERLPESFVRIHRSFVVNKNQVKSYSKEQVVIGESALPVGRKYKNSCNELLQKNVIA